MSKYEPLWNYIKDNDVEKGGGGGGGEILSFKIDHSFLKYKKELENYGYKVKNISMKKSSRITIDIDPENVL